MATVTIKKINAADRYAHLCVEICSLCGGRSHVKTGTAPHLYAYPHRYTSVIHLGTDQTLSEYIGGVTQCLSNALLPDMKHMAEDHARILADTIRENIEEFTRIWKEHDEARREKTAQQQAALDYIDQEWSAYRRDNPRSTPDWSMTQRDSATRELHIVKLYFTNELSTHHWYKEVTGTEERVKRGGSRKYVRGCNSLFYTYHIHLPLNCKCEKVLDSLFASLGATLGMECKSVSTHLSQAYIDAWKAIHKTMDEENHPTPDYVMSYQKEDGIDGVLRLYFDMDKEPGGEPVVMDLRGLAFGKDAWLPLDTPDWSKVQDHLKRIIDLLDVPMTTIPKEISEAWGKKYPGEARLLEKTSMDFANYQFKRDLRNDPILNFWYDFDAASSSDVVCRENSPGVWNILLPMGSSEFGQIIDAYRKAMKQVAGFGSPLPQEIRDAWTRRHLEKELAEILSNSHGQLYSATADQLIKKIMEFVKLTEPVAKNLVCNCLVYTVGGAKSHDDSDLAKNITEKVMAQGDSE